MATDESADARTKLAVERTMLAWWRTALTALAVALGVGRVLPELDRDATTWPYVVIGLGFAVYGIVLFAYGTARGRPATEQPLTAIALVAAAGVLLGISTAALIATG